MKTLALDIGGANLKYACCTGETALTPFALFAQPGQLTDRLAGLLPDSGVDQLRVTMTGELCDCFDTKAQGVDFILDCVERVARGAPIRIWSTRGRFVSPDQARRRPLDVAGANWHALGTCLASRFPRGKSLLIDIGSTTSDLVPLADGACVARGRTDPDRLASGELVYLGVRRTGLAAVTSTLCLGGRRYRVMAEHFATLGDALLLTGALPEAPVDSATADGKPFTREHSAARILRMIGSDLTIHSPNDARALARQFVAAALARLQSALVQVIGAGRVDRLVLAGSGEFLAARLARNSLPDTPIIRASDMLSAAGSQVACASALLQLPDGEAASLRAITDRPPNHAST